MKKSIKLIHISNTQCETLVATFYNLYEATQCRDLLQAKCEDQDNSYYFIEYYNRKTKTTSRQSADTFSKQVLFMHKDIQKNIRMMLS